MALTETRPETEAGGDVHAEQPAPSQIERLIGTGDHLTNGRLLLGFALVLGTLSAVGLGLAALDRTTDDGLLGGISDVLWPSSLVGLVLMGVMPLLLALGIAVVPLQVGSPSIAFPRAAGLALWTWLIGALLFMTSVALDGGVGGADDEAARLGNLSIGVMMAALALAAVCVATTVASHRPLGMGLARVPFFSWSMLVAAPVWILSLGAAAAHLFVGHIADADAAGLAANFDEGVSWFLRAPSVHLLAIPVLGIAADVVVHLTGRRLRPYGAFQGAIAAYAVLSFGAWTQVPAARQTVLWAAFVLLAALPVLATLGGLVDALRRGGVSALASLGASLVALLLLLGVVAAAGVQALDTAGSGQLWDLRTDLLGDAQLLFAVGAALLGGLAGLAHWSERLFGAPAADGVAKGGVAALLLGGALAPTVLLVEGIAAGDGRDGLPEGLVHGLVAAGALLLALGVLAGIAAMLGAARQAYDGVEPAGDGPRGMTLEWSSSGAAIAGALHEGPVRSPYPLADLRDGADEETK